MSKVIVSAMIFLFWLFSHFCFSWAGTLEVVGVGGGVREEKGKQEKENKKEDDEEEEKVGLLQDAGLRTWLEESSGCFFGHSREKRHEQKHKPQTLNPEP